jgi:hypothetical protein
MTHAALVSDGLYWLLAFLTPLLVIFVCAVIRTPPGPAGSKNRPCSHRPRPWRSRPRHGCALPRSQLATRASPATPVIRPGMPLTRRPDKL